MSSTCNAAAVVIIVCICSFLVLAGTLPVGAGNTSATQLVSSGNNTANNSSPVVNLTVSGYATAYPETTVGHVITAAEKPLEIETASNTYGELVKGDNFLNADGTMTTITVGTTGSDQMYPSVFGDNLVWLDYRNGQQAVRLYNFTNCREETISNKSPWKPSIYNDVLVYGIQDSYYGTYDINMYTISTGIESTLTPGDWYNQIDPAIFEDRIVYTDDTKGTRNIVFYNITTNETRYLTNGEPGTEYMYPAIFGDWVAWYAGNEADATLNLFNVATGNSTTIATNCTSFFQSPPSLYNDRLVWQEWQDDHYNIVMYNSTTHEKTLITPFTGDSDQKSPSIFGNYIVWDDSRDQPYGNENIYLYNLETNETSVITHAFPGAHRMNARVYGERIVWSEYSGNFDYDIHAFTLGPEQVPVEPGFIVNATIGMVPLTIQFTDKSTGDPVTRYWDFGDGNYSYDRDPVYTYRVAGRFSPSLIVSAPYSRGYSVQNDLITAGAIPGVKFSTSPPSGVAPLTVVFTDLTSGYPDTWTWDFGDNSTSTEQHPSHVYSYPGTYPISLTAGNLFGNGTATGYVHVISSSVNVSTFTIPGVLQYIPDTGYIEIDTLNETGYLFIPGNNGTHLSVQPKNSGVSPSFILVSRENTTFSLSGSVISGDISTIIVTSEDISSPEFKGAIGENSTLNYSFVMPQYSPEGSVTAIISREITPDEHEQFNLSVQYADCGDYVPGIAYSVQCVESSVSVTGPATITMGVSHDWVRQYSGYTDIRDRFRVHQMNPDGSFKSLNVVFSSYNSTDNRDYYTVTSDDGIDLARLYIPTVGNLTEPAARITLISVTGSAHSNPTEIVLGVDSDWLASNNIGGLADVYEPVKIIRADNQGTIEILTTKFLYFDENRGIDVFQAISPNGLSKFTLVTVAHYTNPLQMLYLSVSTRVTPPVPSGNPTTHAGGGGGGGGGGSYSGNGNQALSVEEPDTAKGTRTGTVQEEVSAAPLSNNGQSSGSQSQESVSSGMGSANPVPQESYVPAVNPPVIPPQPTNSIFTMLIEAAAIVSIFVLVVFSVYMRNRKSE